MDNELEQWCGCLSTKMKLSRATTLNHVLHAVYNLCMEQEWKKRIVDEKLEQINDEKKICSILISPGCL